MTNTFALRAARTAAITRSFPSRNKPLPSDTMTSSWAVSVDRGQRSVQGDDAQLIQQYDTLESVGFFQRKLFEEV